MSAKDVRFSSDARDRMLRGVDILNKTAPPEAETWGLRKFNERRAFSRRPLSRFPPVHRAGL
jgi:hypothetical protein